MQILQHPEIYWISLSALMTALMWVPHILQRIIELKPRAALRDPRHEIPTMAPWAQRAIRAHANAEENLSVTGFFALAIGLLANGDAITAAAAFWYFVFRIGHYFVYLFGIPWLRTPLFAAGFVCTMLLAGRVFGVI